MLRAILSRFTYCLAFTASIAFSGSALAAPALNSAESDFAASQNVSDKELATMRGGYINISGMVIDFALMSRVLVNDELVRFTHFQAGDLELLLANGIPATTQTLQSKENNAILDALTLLNVSITGMEIAQTARSTAQQAAIAGINAFH